MRRITIIGNGSTGYAMASELTLKGISVTLFDPEFLEEEMNLIRKEGILVKKEECVENAVRINCVTKDSCEAFNGAEAALVCTIAQRHEAIIEAFLKHGSPDTVFLFSPGNLGSVLLRQKSSKTHKVWLAGEVESNLCVSRKTGPNQVHVLMMPAKRKVSAFPAKHTEKLIDAFGDIFTFEPARNVLETSLNLPNIDCHLPGCLLNLGWIDRGDFKFYQDGLSDPVMKIIEKLYNEKASVMQALGLEARTTIDGLLRIREADEAGNSILSRFKRIEGPGEIGHRYISEDAYAGISLLVSLGKELEIQTPVAWALMKIASALLDTDFEADGVSLEKLGLSGLSSEALNFYFKEAKQ